MVPTQGDARELPYADDTFDAAYLVTVLGEIPDQERGARRAGAGAQARRAPGGGELAGDPHMVRASALERRAADAGLRMEARVGPRLGYFARLTSA